MRDGFHTVACLDEVGRGALAGPVTIGAVVLTSTTSPAPRNVRDSKLLSDRQRRALVPEVQKWACHWSVGHADAGEVDAVGITEALGLAARRALSSMPLVDAVLLDGPFDFISRSAGPLDTYVVFPRVRADLTCAGVAAASILAKVARDDVMLTLSKAFPQYGFDQHKGYGSEAHREAILRHGSCEAHRKSFKLA